MHRFVIRSNPGQSRRAPRPPPAARGAPPQVVERPCNEQVEPPKQPCIYKKKAILTPEDALHQGLIYAGFDPARQNSVNSGRNDGRFKSFCVFRRNRVRSTVHLFACYLFCMINL